MEKFTSETVEDGGSHFFLVSGGSSKQMNVLSKRKRKLTASIKTSLISVQLEADVEIGRLGKCR